MAFRIGGFPDIIDHCRTGYLANPFEVTSLADGLEFLYSNRLAGHDYRAACRDRAERFYDGRVNANRYLELYKALVTSNPSETIASLVVG
jgi:glycosyltransferase involved in cell wall biosynthesis